MDTDGTAPLGLVPPGRLGRLLRDARTAEGLSLEDLAGSSGGLSVTVLAEVENGRRTLSDVELATVARIYGLDTSRLVPARSELVIDLDEGRIIAGEQTAEVDGSLDSNAILGRYLSLIYSMRKLQPGREIALRSDDLEVLGKALHVSPASVRADLESLMADPGDSVGVLTRRLRRRILVPAAGVLVGVTGIGALLLVQPGAADPSLGVGAGSASASVEQGESTDSSIPVEPEVEIGTAIVQEREPGDQGEGTVSERTGADGSAPVEPNVEIGDAIAQLQGEEPYVVDGQ
ncbi:MAG: hypothetical protein JJLCMIEE_01841 [Acidimicrobiales bacterium]|nr:hypothetical protein [Acidimicrobiales bacterium]